MQIITEKDLQGKGNVGMPDTPELSAQDMQAKLDELSRVVIIPAFNANVDSYTIDKAAQDRAVIKAQGDIDDHKADIANPHGVTAQQAGAYTKAQTDSAIKAKVIEIGSADMTKAEYAGTKAGAVKDSDKLDGQSPSFYATAVAAATAQAAANAAQLTANAALPRSGGTLTGEAVAVSGNFYGACIRNIMVTVGAPTGASQGTNMIIMVRK